MSSSSEDGSGGQDFVYPSKIKTEGTTYLTELHEAVAAAGSASSSSLPSHYDTLQDDFAFLTSSDGESLCSPLESSISAPFPFYGEGISPETDISSSIPVGGSSWAVTPPSEYEKPVETNFNHYNAFGEIQHHARGPTVIDYDMEFAPYDPLASVHVGLPADSADLVERAFV
jgi:hypothetical protein